MKDNNNIYQLCKSRRTIRKYNGCRVKKEDIDMVIKAGLTAPSAHNLQPWEFVVILNKVRIEEIACTLQHKADDLYAGFNIIMRDTSKNIAAAKVLILAYTNDVISKKFKRLGPPYSEVGNIYEIQSVSTALQNMQLYAYSIGLGMAWYGMPIFCEEEINTIVGKKSRLLAVMSLGYPADKPKPTKRYGIKEKVVYL